MGARRLHANADLLFFPFNCDVFSRWKSCLLAINYI